MNGGGLASALMAPPDMPDVSADTPDSATASPVTANASAPQPMDTTSAPINGSLTPPAAPAPAAPDFSSMQPSTPAPTDLPRFARTFKNTLQGILLGWEMGGIPGMVAGGVNPRGVQQQAQAQGQMQQAKITFANAQAAHEVAMAHQADAEYQALPEKLQQEAEGRWLDDLNKAKQSGFLPVATIQLDQGTAQNAQNANTALNSVKAQFGAVPQGLLYIHTGNSMTVLKLQDPNAALPTINAARMAMGQKPIDSATFSALAPADRDSMARNAINFDDPRDANGMVTQDSINLAQMRLATVKAQPAFNGQDALVASLQATVDHQKSVLDTGAGQAAIRAGQAKGAEAVAAQPGTTQAQVANIQATAPAEAAAAAQKTGAEEAAKFPWEARLEQMKQQGDPVFAFDPVNKQTIQVSRGEAIANGMTNIVKVGQSEIDKAKTQAMQLGDAAMNIQAYKMASQRMDGLGPGDIATVASVIGDSSFKAHFLGAELPTDWANELYRARGWQTLPEAAKDAVVNYIAARPAAISLLRAINPGVRLNDAQIATELRNIPDPTTPSDIRDKQFARLDRNIDQASKTLVKVPGVDLPSEIRDNISKQQEATDAVNARVQGAATGQYRNAKGLPMKQGQEAYANGRYIGTVSKLYGDGSYDVSQ